MECPVCKSRLTHEKIEEVWVDICHEHGVWLDKGELDRIMESAKYRGQSEGLVRGLWSHTHSQF